jgi:hypothetical protein
MNVSAVADAVSIVLPPEVKDVQVIEVPAGETVGIVCAEGLF